MQERRIARRRFIERAGAVAAGVAGASAVGAVAAGPAQADAGQPVIAGQNNPSAEPTGIQLQLASSPGSTPALRLNNDYGPSLTLEPVWRDGVITTAAAPGSIFMTLTGDLTTVAQGDGSGKHLNHLYSPSWALMPVPVQPFRWLDTRAPVQTSHVVPGSASFVAGRVHPRNTSDPDLVLDFAPLLNETYVAAQVIVSVLSANADGWLTVWGDGPWPGAVSINFLGGRVIGGFAQCELTGVFEESTETFGRMKLKITHAAAITIDVVGFITTDRLALFKSTATDTMARAAAQPAVGRTPKTAARRSQP